MSSSFVRLDVRLGSRGGRLLHGTERISPVSGDEATAAILTADGASAAGWTVANPICDTTRLSDGWHEFKLTEGEGATEASLLVLNGSNVAIHEGVLSKDETWAAGKVHVVRHWVRVPAGVTLTIASGAAVKFCEDTGILVEGALKARGASFTFIADDSVDGDTDMNGPELGLLMYDIKGSGTIELADCFDRRSYSEWSQDIGVTDDSKASSFVRLDVRLGSRGGCLLHGTERISPIAAEETSDASLTAGEVTAAGWTIANPTYSTTRLTDGWHEFKLTEGESAAEATLLVLNGGDVAVHGGVLSGDETWSAGKIHVVRHWVRIPAGVTLTIASGASVKFCEDTGILVEGALKARGASFTFVADDSVGGDTDMNGPELGLLMYDIKGSGTIELTDCFDRRSYSEWSQDIGVTDDSKTSSFVRLDVRLGGRGGRLLHGVERLSPFAADETEAARLTADGASAAGWTVANPNCDTTRLSDGWHEFKLTEGEGATEASLLVLNGSNVAIHGGVLAGDETWAAGKVHVVRHWVRVPAGVTLTIASGAAVKFCEDTGILVEGALKARGASFTFVADDSVGGDTDMNGSELGLLMYDIKGNGVIEIEDCLNRAISHISVANGDISSDFVRLDVRTSVGGRMLAGEEYISPVAEEENANAKLTVDGAELAGWSVNAPWIDSTKNTNNQWHVFSLNEGYETFEAELLPMNRDDVVIHEGVLEKDETWEKEKLHVVRHWVRVPRNITLTIEAKAVVKFCLDTGILVEEGGKLVGEKAVFTSILDDSDGGDTDVNGISSAVGFGFYSIIGDDKDILLTDCDNRGVANLKKDTTWTSDDVIHIIGTLKIPNGVTLTIEPGTVVKLATGASIVVEDGGAVKAQDALFTHIADDSEEAGGDTNGDGDATLPDYDAYALPAGFEPDGSGKDQYDNEIRYITPQPYTGGTIKSGETKILAGNRVHNVTGDITISSGGKLIVQPGAIVKMGDKNNTSKIISINVQSGGTLEAIGNRAQPIVFTSIKDDNHGGDTNEDGNKSIVEEGDWRGIITNGTVIMDYCHLLYAGYGQFSNQGDAALRCNGGTTTVNNSQIAHSMLRLVLASGNVTLANCLLQEARYGIEGNATVVNSIFSGCSDYTLSGNSNVSNTIFYNTASISGNISYSCFWKTSNVQENGNCFQKDPLFTDVSNGDYTLMAGSPCIDAGNGSFAPEFDYWGTPRCDDVNIADKGTPAKNGCVPDIGIYERAVNADSKIDLQADSVSGPISAKAGDSITVKWKVTNIGEDTAYGPWRDAIYLVNADETIDQSVLVAAPVAGMQLEGGKSNIYTASVTLPAIQEGNWRLKVQVNPNRNVFEGRLVENNTAVSSTLLKVSIQEYEWADGVSGKLKSGSIQTFKLKASTTTSLLGSITGPKGATILCGIGYMPTSSQNNGSVITDDNGKAFIGLPPTMEDVYIVVQTDDEGGKLSITFEEGKMALTVIHPAEVPKEGTVTFAILGAGLPIYEGEAELVASNGNVYKAQKTYPVKAEGMFATFKLDGLLPGKYTLRVINNDEETALTAAIQQAIEVKDEKERKQLSAKLVMPSSARAGRSGTIGIEYVNQGNVDISAPVFTLESSQLIFKLSEDVVYDGKVKVMGLSSEYVAGILRPGVKVRMDVPMQVKATATGSLQCKLMTSSEDGRNADNTYPLGDLLNASWLINPSSEKDVEKIEHIRTMVGNTWGEFYVNLASFATTYVLDYNTYDNNYESLKSAFAAYVTGMVEDMMAAKTRGGKTRAGGWPEPPLATLGPCSERKDTLQRVTALEYERIEGSDWERPTGQNNLRQRTNRHERMLAQDNSDPGNIWIYHDACGWWHRIPKRPIFEEGAEDDLGLVNENGPTIVIVHGNLHSIHSPWVYAMARAWHDKEPNANIVAVDWGDASTSSVVSGLTHLGVTLASDIMSLGEIGGGISTIVYTDGMGAAAGWEMIAHGAVGIAANHALNVSAPIDLTERRDWIQAGVENLINGAAFLANPEFALVPSISLPSIATKVYGEMITSILPLSNLTLIGHSHGAHVAGMIAGWMARSPYDPMPQRLIGLETSSMTAHLINFGDKFPDAWNGKSAMQTEFYKTSHMMSMGSDHREELWADYNFMVVERNNDFVYQPGAHLMDNGFFNADNREGRLGAERHDYAPAWFIDTIINDDEWHGLGYAWKGDASWKALVGDTAHNVPANSYAGVINGETHSLEGLDELKKNQWNGNEEGAAWNYMDAGWRRQAEEHSEHLRHFYGWHAAMQSYRLLDAEMPSEFQAGDEEDVTLMVDNTADNTSVPYEEYWEHNGDGTYKQEEVFMPWREERPLSNECWLVDVREAGEGASFTKADISYLYSLPCYRVWQKKVESLDDFLLPGKSDTWKMKWDIPAEGVEQFHSDRKLGCDKDGEPLEDGEWFALVTLCGVPASEKEVNAMPSVNRNTAFRTDNWWGDLDRLDGVDVRMIKVYAGDKPFARLCVQGQRVENDGWGPSVKANKNHVCTIQVDATQSKAVSPHKLKDYEWDVWEHGYSFGSPSLQIGPAPSYGSKTGTIQVTIPEGSEGGFITIKLLVRDDDNNVKWTVAHVRLIQNNDEDEDETDNSSARPVPTFIVRSWDPNEIVGPTGFGDEEGAENPWRYVIPGEELEFTIYFENKHDATGAAQEIRVNTYLSGQLDWDTFKMVETGLRNQVDMSLAGVADGSTVFDLEGTDYKAGVAVTIDKASGMVSWYLRVIDSTTVDGWPADDADGLLLPNDPPDTPDDERTHRGEGHLTYRVKVRDDAGHGGLVTTWADIYFDYNEVIVTDPSWSNTVWSQPPFAPSSSTPTDGASIPLEDIRRLAWNRAEGAATYDVQLWKDNGGTRTLVDSVEGLTVSYWTLPVKLEDEGRYFWQVTAVNPIGKTEGPLWTFRVSNTIIKTQTLELLKGWNWVGFSVLPEDRKYGSVLGSAGFKANDRINGKAGSATFNGSLWLPNRYEIEFGKMYNIYVSNPVTLEVTGLPSEMAAVEVVQGWNWISNPTDTAVEPSELIHSAGFQSNDRISGKSGSVTFNGSKWMGTKNFRLEPGKGYKLYTNRPGTVRFAVGE